jgi:putative DNA primase/helicase
MKPNFERINCAALVALPILLSRWLPDGKRQGREYVARNPTRNDRRPGSFSINVVTGEWADFADDAKGRDVVSLYAYLRGIRQGQAARELARMLRVPS